MFSVLVLSVLCFFFFKQKTAYELRISDWSSDVCSSDLATVTRSRPAISRRLSSFRQNSRFRQAGSFSPMHCASPDFEKASHLMPIKNIQPSASTASLAEPGGYPLTLSSMISPTLRPKRSEEHTSELQSLMRISYAVS